MGVKSATTYDSYGNSTANVVQPSADAPLMKTETVYNDNGNYVISQKDVRGNSVVNLIDSNGRMDIEKADLLAYAHGHYYSLGKCLGHFGYSIRKKKGPIVRK